MLQNKAVVYYDLLVHIYYYLLFLKKILNAILFSYIKKFKN